MNPVDRGAFAARFERHAPEGLRLPEATMDRLAETWVSMQNAAIALDIAGPNLERAITATAEGSRTVEEVCRSIPAETWDAVVPLVDDWEVIAGLVADDTFQKVLEVSGRLAQAEAVPAAAPEPSPVAELEAAVTAAPAPERVPLGPFGWAHEVEPSPAPERFVPNGAAVPDLALQHRNLATYADLLAAAVEDSPMPSATRAAELAVRNFPNAAGAVDRPPMPRAGTRPSKALKPTLVPRPGR